ncbi:MAG: 2'-5' RNA ligase family protein [Chloroflexota bacterium]|jgi:2'-5' RNA ligase
MKPNGYAVELYFDDGTEQRVLEMRRALIEQGYTTLLDLLEFRPHVSLTVLSNTDLDRLNTLLLDFSTTVAPFEVRLSAIGAFPTTENVLFLVPAASHALLECHRRFHQRLAEIHLESWPYYLPGQWVPHCTIEINIPAERFAAALDFTRRTFQPLVGRCEAIGVIEFRPVVELATWPLSGAADWAANPLAC